MKKVKLAVMFLCAIGLYATATAQAPVVAPLPEEQRATAGQIAILLDAMRIKEQMASIMDMIPALMQQQMQKQLEAFGGLQLTPEQEEQVTKFLRRRLEQSMNLYPMEEIIADTGTVYQKYISREDADVVIAFYQTPAAQRLIDAQPAVAQEYLPLVMSRLETRLQAFTEETARESQELLKKLQ
ncbi:MAG: DUF2059 domain-containing protein [Acidobacteria bacterium]|nr:DUF2059 domain-containing protein [Acidobacteriota bacterium]